MGATPVISIAIQPFTSADQDRLGRGLIALIAEDPTISVETTPAHDNVIIGGGSDVHLEAILDRLRLEFGVEATVGVPQIIYRETVTRASDGEMKYWTQVNGRGQYAHVKLLLAPAPPGSGYAFGDHTAVGAIPAEFIESANAGIQEALRPGVCAGYPVIDVRVQVYDGSHHEGQSSNAAFRLAGALAFLDAAKKAGPILLEPVMRVQVVVPGDFADDVTTGLSQRSGRILSREERGGISIVIARVPVSEMFGYASDLRSTTFGRGTYSTEFDGYQPATHRPDTDGGTHDSFVGAPRRPAPNDRDGAISLPEPEDDGWVGR